MQETYQENLLLGQYDVCLSNIDIIYLLTGDKKKRLMIGHRFNDKVKGLHILCKVKETYLHILLNLCIILYFFENRICELYHIALDFLHVAMVRH